MSQTAVAARHTTPGRFRLGRTSSLVLLASIVVSLLAASSAPTPLYATYQAEWGFSPMTTTVVFGVYAVAVLVALLIFGRLSDHVGRRPVLFVALLVQAAALVVFALAGGVPALMAARVVQGLATGAALAALGAGMLDIDRVRGTTANAVAPGIGTGGGALLSALVVQFLPAPTHLIYLALLAVLAVQAVGVALMPETVSRAPGARQSLIPEVKLPRNVRGPVAIAAPVLFAVWALAGFYASLGPAVVRNLAGSTSAVYGGLGLFVLAAVAALAVLAMDKRPAHTLLTVGIVGLIVGVAGSLVALSAGSAAGFLVATGVAGIGFGSGFQGAIRLVVPLVAAHERAGVLALLFVISYLGLGVPAVVAGYVVVHSGSLLDTAREYGVAVIVLAALAGFALVRRRLPRMRTAG
ncbi:MFS transporter [Asanoa sp. NPDC050611]|uniref:MFS transporter n=1 Tax=Asanoa sp. NPDC050611 TaxID=3157098 RepID=UPI0033FE3BA5